MTNDSGYKTDQIMDLKQQLPLQIDQGKGGLSRK